MTPILPAAAVIFDLDGLLLDTERIAYETFVVTCREVGVRIDHGIYRQCIGANETHARALLTAAFGGAMEYEELRAAWITRYDDTIELQAVPVKPGAPELLALLRARRLPLGIATSSRRERAIAKLQRAGIIDYFAGIVAGDEVAESKPAPAIYQVAAERLGVPAGDCLAIEDSENGVRAALAAGMRVIQVPDLVAPSADLRALGHVIVTSLHEVVAHI
jgi:HAD superfamily hydrolase (TIGR01509 family)